MPQLDGWLAKDPFGAKPADKLAFLKDATDWSTNIGHPGPANTAIGEVFGTFVIPNMFASAARGEATPKEAVAEAEAQIKPIFEKWRKRGLVGGTDRRPAVTVVEVRGLVKQFDGGRVHAVDGIDLATEEGEYLVLLGPSGCGKTTLLRTIAGLEQPSEGEVRIDGQVVNDLPPRARKIAMVFQSYALYPHKTVRQNIVFPLKAERMDKDEQAARPAGRPSCSASTSCWTASPASFPAASASGSPWPGRWSASPRCSCSTSRCPTWTPSCAPAPATSSSGSSSGSGRPPST